MPLCRICKEDTSDGIHLSDGGIVHESCLEAIQSQIKETNNEISVQLIKLSNLKSEIERREGLVFKIVSIFAKPNEDIADIEKKIQTIRRNVDQLTTRIRSLIDTSVSIYDYFLTYPPDWDERRRQVEERDGNQCSKCPNRIHLHLHHIKPLSIGGSNKISNLELLCRDCHSELHGGSDFTGEFTQTETAFSKRVTNALPLTIGSLRRATIIRELSSLQNLSILITREILDQRSVFVVIANFEMKTVHLH